MFERIKWPFCSHPQLNVSGSVLIRGGGEDREEEREKRREGGETESRCHKRSHSTSSSGQPSLWNYPLSADAAFPSLGYENPGRRDGSYLPSPGHGRYMPFWERAYSRHMAAFSAYWTGFPRITITLWRCFENTQLFMIVATLLCSVCW